MRLAATSAFGALIDAWWFSWVENNRQAFLRSFCPLTYSLASPPHPAHLCPVIYLDHNATTPVLPEVQGDVMLPYLTDEWANHETGVL